MIPNLSRYLARLYDTIYSRQEIAVEEFELFDQSVTAGRTSELFMRLRFWDGAAPAPDLSQVLRETDGYLYPVT